MHKKRKLTAVVVVFVVILTAVLVFKSIKAYPFLFELFFDKGVNLKQSSPSNLNILLLGIGGDGHDGPNLTDTIIFANINEGKNRVTLTSIPRDLWVPYLENSNKKINQAYSDGESKRKGGGLIEAKAIVGKVVGQDINYAVRIDFNGFIKAVDILGGIDIDIENTFDDYNYPVSGKENDACGFTDEEIDAFIASSPAEIDRQEKFSCRYKHLHFDKGINHMDGQTALEYVRSRHALGVEGGDFARSKRQQKIIDGFRNKLLSAETLMNPTRFIDLYNVLSDSIDTDIKQKEFDDFIRLAQKMKNAKIDSFVLDVGDEVNDRFGLLVEAPISKEFSYLSVLLPRLGTGEFSEIHKYINCWIKNETCIVSPTPVN